MILDAFTSAPPRRWAPAGWAFALIGASVLAWPLPAFAHADETFAASAWTWSFTPDIVLATVLALALHAAGWRRLRGRGSAPGAGRAIAFSAGVLLVFLALASPIDSAADHSFAVHQVQHLLLHSLGPMLIMLAAPHGPMVAGVPVSWRPWLVRPLSSAPVRRVVGALARPAPALLLFVGTLYFWEVPRWHQLAVSDDGVHYLMHVTMLIAGLLFFHCVFDPRPEPIGASVRQRMLIVWGALAANILLGAYTTLKSDALYPIYDAAGRLGGLDAMSDEQLGGLIIWIPGSMMFVVAALLLLKLWDRHEVREQERRAQGLAPLRAARKTTGKDAPADNRALGWRLGVLAVAAFCIAITVGVVSARHMDAAPMEAPIPGADAPGSSRTPTVDAAPAARRGGQAAVPARQG